MVFTQRFLEISVCADTGSINPWLTPVGYFAATDKTQCDITHIYLIKKLSNLREQHLT